MKNVVVALGVFVECLFFAALMFIIVCLISFVLGNVVYAQDNVDQPKLTCVKTKTDMGTVTICTRN